MDIGALGAELAVSLASMVSMRKAKGRARPAQEQIMLNQNKTHLGKVFADGFGGDTQLVAEGTGIAGLAGALTVELAGNMCGI